MANFMAQAEPGGGSFMRDADSSEEDANETSRRLFQEWLAEDSGLESGSDDDSDSMTSSRRARLRRLDEESYAGDNSDSDDEVVIRTGDENPPMPTSVLIDDRKKRVYSLDTLLRLIPETESFDKVRETLRIQKTEYKYSRTTSNKVFCREHYRRWGTPPNKSLRLYKVTYRGDQLDRFYGDHHPFSTKRVFRPLRRKPVSKKRPIPGIKARPVVVTTNVYKSRPVRLTGLKPVTKLQYERNQTIAVDLGGKAYRIERSKINATKWYRERRGQPFFYNTFSRVNMGLRP